MEIGELGTTAVLLAVLVFGVALGRWRGKGTARRSHRLLAARVTLLERDVERLSVELARLDSTAVLWQPPPDLPADVGSDAPH